MGISHSKEQSFQLPEEIERLAADTTGVIGSLYDAKGDRFLQIALPELPVKSTKRDKNTLNPTIRVGRVDDRDLLDIIGMDKNLCLSVHFGITPSQGVPSLMKDPFIINEQTRYLSYYLPTMQSTLADKRPIRKSKALKALLGEIEATHIVTQVQRGIHVVIILQFSSNHTSDLDALLAKIQRGMAANTLSIEPTDESSLAKDGGVRVFANIPHIAASTNLADVCRKLTALRAKVAEHHRIAYTLRPIRSLCPWYSKPQARYKPLDSTQLHEFEKYLSDLWFFKTKPDGPVQRGIEAVISEHFKQHYVTIQKQKADVQGRYQESLKKLGSSLSAMRRGDVDADTSQRSVNATDDSSEIHMIRGLNEQMNRLIDKSNWVQTLQEQSIEYWNLKERGTFDNVPLETIEQELRKQAGEKRVFCFNDQLRQQSATEWENYQQTLNNGQNTSNIVYADFSLCSVSLPQMKLLTLEKTTDSEKETKQETTSPLTPSSSEKPVADESKHLPKKFVNILLLGESGVGKSTFINAVVNYFHFDTLADACEPLVLMPVSFIITEGDDFRERLVTLGDADPNEDHHHPGQSVTQHCRSYVFSISARTTIRLIDTPGMGDTRGLDQDDRNMQHILSFISHLSHLDAICILLKPNLARLNVVFRSYFARLLGFLGERARKNVIFCYTNTRSTFYAPGDTGPLLKSMLASQSMQDVPHTKKNTFCFDSAAFRYLIAQRNGVRFGDDQKREYEASWTRSAAESRRLFEYICQDIRSCRQEDWRSVEHAHVQINGMVRPMMGALRNTIRNMLILEKTSSPSLIELTSKATFSNTTLCFNCYETPQWVNEFWILPEEPHVVSDRCNRCQCAHGEHSKRSYLLGYRAWRPEVAPAIGELKIGRNRLCMLLISFVEFLRYVARLPMANDSIAATLNWMIKEEEYICSTKESSSLNGRLCEELKKFREKYENVWMAPTSTRTPMNLHETYTRIQVVRDEETIRNLMDSIRKTEQASMNKQEKDVSQRYDQKSIDEVQSHCF